MSLYIPALDMSFVAIPKNASRFLGKAIRVRWTEALPGRRGLPVLMVRDPHSRMEATWRFYRAQGMEIPFSQWVIEVCSDPNWPHDPHLRPQRAFFPAATVVFWDFRRFGRIFDLEITQNPPKTPMKWSDQARKRFHQRYRADLRLWRSRND